jgi:cytochrome c553
MNRLFKYRQQKLSYILMVFIVLLSLLPQKSIALISETPVESTEPVTRQEVPSEIAPTNQIDQEINTSPEPLNESSPSLEEGTNTTVNEGTMNDGLNINSIDTSEAAATLSDNIVDSQRPYITGIFLSLYDMENKSNTAELINILRIEEMTRVSLDTEIIIEINDIEPITAQTLNNPITLFNKDGVVGGTITPTFDTDTTTLKLKPDTPLSKSTTYYIMFNPRVITGVEDEPPLSFTDNSLNTAFPLIKKFTTVSEVVLSANINHETANWEDNPHGYYTNNVNTCANCHGIHKTEKNKLDKPNPATIPNMDSMLANYCMACHDGTTAAPLPDVSDYVPDHSDPNKSVNPVRNPIISTHDSQTEPELQSNAGSCTSCHNPHLTWSEKNPNIIKDHLVYEHEDLADYPEGKKIGEIDSRNQLCENCHDNNTSFKKELALEKTNGEAYKILHYRKSTSAIGTIEDYDLCFSCHNPDKEEEATSLTNNKIYDILSFYADTDSGHIISAQDGNRLNGPIPCAECHETHAATNLKLLKERFGHENQQRDFEFLEKDSWVPAKEREFCMKCHNGKTAFYGVTGISPSEENHPKPIPNAEGEVEPEPACSSCHGGTGTVEEKARRAAHSPLEYSKSLPK